MNNGYSAKLLKAKGIYCIECTKINKKTASQIKEIIYDYRTIHPGDTICIITKNTESIDEDGYEILSDVDNLFIRLSSVYTDSVLMKCSEINREALLLGSMYNVSELRRINYKMEKIFSKVNPKWSKSQKVMYLYNYIMMNTKYDPEYLEKSSLETRSLRGFLSQQTVCAGYSYMFKELMDRLGIPCEYIIGKARNGAHAWNSLTLDNKKYYLDLTWDSQNYKTDTYNEGLLYFFGQEICEFNKYHKPFPGFEEKEEELVSYLTEEEKKALLSSVMTYSQNYNFETIRREDESSLKVAKIGSYAEYSNSWDTSLLAYISFIYDGHTASLPKIFLSDIDLDKERRILDSLKSEKETIKRRGDLTKLEKERKLSETYNALEECKHRFKIINGLFSIKHTSEVLNIHGQYLGGIKDNKYFYNKRKRNSTIRYRVIKRNDKTSIIVIDSMYKTKVAGVKLNSYNALTLSLDGGKLSFNRYKILTENDLMTLKESKVLSDGLLSEKYLKKRNIESQGYLGFIKDNKLYYYPEVSNVLNRNTLSYSIDGSLNISVNHM